MFAIKPNSPWALPPSSPTPSLWATHLVATSKRRLTSLLQINHFGGQMLHRGGGLYDTGHVLFDNLTLDTDVKIPTLEIKWKIDSDVLFTKRRVIKPWHRTWWQADTGCWRFWRLNIECCTQTPPGPRHNTYTWDCSIWLRWRPSLRASYLFLPGWWAGCHTCRTGSKGPAWSQSQNAGPTSLCVPSHSNPGNVASSTQGLQRKCLKTF